MTASNSINNVISGYTPWFGSGNTLNGQVTLNVTDDGTANGNALFLNNMFVMPLAWRDTTTSAEFVFVSGKAISENKKQIILNAGTGVTLLGALTSIIDAPDGTLITVCIWGN